MVVATGAVGKEGEENMIMLSMDVMETSGELGVGLSINEENVKTTMEVLKTKLAHHKETQVRVIQEISSLINSFFSLTLLSIPADGDWGLLCFRQMLIVEGSE